MSFNDHTNASLPSDVKVTARGDLIHIQFRLFAVDLKPEGAQALAQAISEVTPVRQRDR